MGGVPFLLIPAGVDKEEWWSTNPTEQDQMAAVLHVALDRMSRQWSKPRDTPDEERDRFRVSRVDFEALVPGEKVVPIKEHIRDAGVLEWRDDSSKDAKRPKSHRFTDEFLERCDGVCRYYPKRKTLRDKVAAQWADAKVRSFDHLPSEYALQASCLQRSLMVDVERVHCAAPEIEEPKKRLTALRNALLIESDRFWFHKDDYGRFHCPLTGLSKVLRKSCITLDGRSTVEIDVANCQPLLLTILLREAGIGGEGVDRWQDECEQGLIYSELVDEYPFELSDSRSHAEKRKWLKGTPFMVWLYASQDYKEPLHRIIEAKYPEVARFVELSRYALKGHRLCDRLQRIESSIVIPTVASLIADGSPCGSIHDSVVCPEDEGDEVRRRLSQSFLRRGLVVKLSSDQTSGGLRLIDDAA